MNPPASLPSASLFIIIFFIFIIRMAQLTPAGVILCAFCLITQVLSQNTISPINSTALAGNQTVNANDTMATNTYVSANSTTAPAGAGVQSRASALCVLVAVASSLLHRCC